MTDALFDMPDAKVKTTGIVGIGSAVAKTHDWITPRHIIEALGPFDLDVCQCHTQPWRCAATGYVLPVDGLNEPWAGRVWCNPPYSVHASAWMAKMARHNCGTALIFARTETEMFFESVWGKASAILFLEGRLHFHHPDGRRAEMNAGGPSCLIAYGTRDAEALARSGLHGAFVNDIDVLRRVEAPDLLGTAS